MEDSNFLYQRKRSFTLLVGGLAMVWILGNLGLQNYTTNKLESLASQGRLWEGIVRSYDIIRGLDNRNLNYVLWGPKFSAENYLRTHLP